ncbi:MAG: hypothetical protein ACI9OJ_001389, partial [Myxococcota bacterium]
SAMNDSTSSERESSATTTTRTADADHDQTSMRTKISDEYRERIVHL